MSVFRLCGTEDTSRCPPTVMTPNPGPSARSFRIACSVTGDSQRQQRTGCEGDAAQYDLRTVLRCTVEMSRSRSDLDDVVCGHRLCGAAAASHHVPLQRAQVDEATVVRPVSQRQHVIVGCSRTSPSLSDFGPHNDMQCESSDRSTCSCEETLQL